MTPHILTPTKNMEHEDKKMKLDEGSSTDTPPQPLDLIQILTDDIKNSELKAKVLFNILTRIEKLESIAFNTIKP
jgi:hypothetical protein